MDFYLFSEGVLKFLTSLTGSCKDFVTNQDKNSEIWKFIMTDGRFKEGSGYEIGPTMLELFLTEVPSNTMSESLVRKANMVRSSLRKRITTSVLYVTMMIFKHSPGVEFWEPHLKRLFEILIYVVGGQHSIPEKSKVSDTWKDKLSLTSIFCRKLERKLRKNKPEVSDSRQRRARLKRKLECMIPFMQIDLDFKGFDYCK